MRYVKSCQVVVSDPAHMLTRLAVELAPVSSVQGALKTQLTKNGLNFIQVRLLPLVLILLQFWFHPLDILFHTF